MNVKLVKANQTYMPSHRAFKSIISFSFGLILNHCFQLRTPPSLPFPSTCPPPPPCSHNLPPPPAHTIPQCIWHREQPAGTREPQDAKTSAQPVTPKLCIMYRTAAKQPLGGICCICNRRFSGLQSIKCSLRQYLWLLQPSLPRIHRSDWSSL